MAYFPVMWLVNEIKVQEFCFKWLSGLKAAGYVFVYNGFNKFSSMTILKQHVSFSWLGVGEPVQYC